MLVALHECLGNVSEACVKAGIGRTTHYGWLQDDSAYKQAVEDMTEADLDFAESKLKERISGVQVKKGEGVYSLPPDVTAIMYYLNCKGSRRGYSYKQQVEHSGGIVVNGEVRVIHTGHGIATDESKIDV